MRTNKLISTLAMALILAACGTGGEEDKPIGGNARMNSIVACMQVHGAAVQAGLAPLAVAQGGPDAEQLIAQMREAVKDLPSDHAELPETYAAVVDSLRGVSGKGIEAAVALAESPGYTEKVAKFAAWHQANCQSADEANAH